MIDYDEDKLWGWIAAFVVPFLVVLLACTIIKDDAGTKEWNHRESLPAGVVQVNPWTYLIEPSAKIAPGAICRGSTSQGPPVTQATDVAQLHHATFVQCQRSQTWNDNRRGSPNFGNAMMTTLTEDRGFQIPFAAWLLVCLTAVASLLVSGASRQKRRRRAQEESERIAKSQQYDRHLAEYRAVQAAYARDEIDDLQLDKKIKNLVANGFDIPDGEIFR